MKKLLIVALCFCCANHLFGSDSTTVTIVNNTDYTFSVEDIIKSSGHKTGHNCEKKEEPTSSEVIEKKLTIGPKQSKKLLDVERILVDADITPPPTYKKKVYVHPSLELGPLKNLPGHPKPKSKPLPKKNFICPFIDIQIKLINKSGSIILDISCESYPFTLERHLLARMNQSSNMMQRNNKTIYTIKDWLKNTGRKKSSKTCRAVGCATKLRSLIEKRSRVIPPILLIKDQIESLPINISYEKTTPTPEDSIWGNLKIIIDFSREEKLKRIGAKLETIPDIGLVGLKKEPKGLMKYYYHLGPDGGWYRIRYKYTTGTGNMLYGDMYLRLKGTIQDGKFQPDAEYIKEDFLEKFMKRGLSIEKHETIPEIKSKALDK